MQGWLHSILYVLFENAMSVVKLWAVIAGTRTRIYAPQSCVHASPCPQKGILQPAHTYLYEPWVHYLHVARLLMICTVMRLPGASSLWQSKGALQCRRAGPEAGAGVGGDNKAGSL